MTRYPALMRLKSAAACLLLTSLSACFAGSETSIALIFPNEVAKSAIRRLQVEAYNPETNSASAMARDCSDFTDKARAGQKPLGIPDPGDFSCRDASCGNDWFVDKEIPKVQSGKKIVYVLGYSTTEENATPILEGCNDRFDSAGGGDERNDVPVELKLVIPESTRLVKAAGDRQVGRAGEALGVPLTIRVEADAPSGSGGPYVIPGVPLEFTSMNPDFRITTGDNPVTFRTYSDQAGSASIQLQLPSEPGQGDILVEAKALEATKAEGRSLATFSVSVTSPITFAVKELITPAGNNRPIGVAIGQVVAGGPREVAVLSCAGSDINCRVGTEAVAPFGETRLTVLTDLGNSKAVIPVNIPGGASLGVLPAGITTGNISTATGDDIALVNSRRHVCQQRRCAPHLNPNTPDPCGCYRPDPTVEIACPCEGSEVLVFSATAGTITLDQRLVMTGSNAVALAAVKQGGAANTLLNVVIAAQGRSKHERPCTRSSRCLPYAAPGCDLSNPGRSCGCPPAERCECFGANCMDTQTPGVCVARDKVIDQLAHRSTTELYNHLGCQTLTLTCKNTGDQADSTCSCSDTENGNMCLGKDGCNCRVPDRIQVGDTDAPVPPNGLAAGQIRAGDEWDLVVPSVGGLELVESKGSQDTYQWKGEPIVNAPIHAALVAQMDNNTVNEGPDAPADVVWYARRPCLDGTNFLDRCPVWRDLPEGSDLQGCLGIYFTAGARSVLDLRPPMVGGCRRHMLTYTPDGFCTGDFNSDGALDVVVSSRTLNELQVYSGDGRGGLLDPPDAIMLPGGAGGPMACGDVDGDQIDDVIVVDIASGGIQILRSGS